MTKKYIKRLQKYPRKLQGIILDTLSQIAVGDFSGLDISSLSLSKKSFRCRVGNIRIIFHTDIDGKNIIDDIGSRGDIYK